jgi:hypothetical protein
MLMILRTAQTRPAPAGRGFRRLSVVPRVVGNGSQKADAQSASLPFLQKLVHVSRSHHIDSSVDHRRHSLAFREII